MTYIQLTQPKQIHAALINSSHSFYALLDGVADCVTDALFKLRENAVTMKHTLQANKVNICEMEARGVFKDQIVNMQKNVDEALHAIDRELGLIEAMIEGIH